MNDLTWIFLIATAMTGLLTVCAERILIPILKTHKMGQKILEIGPRWHKSKEGTPTMGGLGFILASLIVITGYVLFQASTGKSEGLIPLTVTLAYAVANGAIGFVDDYCKLIKKQNEGLSRGQKLVLQLAISAGYLAVMTFTGSIDTVITLGTGGILISPILYYPIALLVLCGVVNGANITDGIDGLASSVVLAIGIFFAVWAFRFENESLTLISALAIGASAGFLVYNWHPARVFMGDTGSLYFGGLLIGATLMAGEEVIGLIISAVFIFEMLTSFLQIWYFRLTHGKRLFKIAPFHHLLEQYGWGEVQVVLAFFGAEILVCTLAYFLL